MRTEFPKIDRRNISYKPNQDFKFRYWTNPSNEDLDEDYIWGNDCGLDSYMFYFHNINTYDTTTLDGDRVESEDKIYMWNGTNGVFMLCSNLRDKTGKDIYELDFVKTKFGLINIIIRHRGAFIMLHESGSFIPFLIEPELEKDLEVISNYYTDPINRKVFSKVLKKYE